MISKAIEQYAAAMSQPADEVLLEVERATHLYTIAPQMMSGPVQGGLLTLLARLCGARHILEIGTFTGYGTICLSRGLSDGPACAVTTLEANPEFGYLIDRHIALAGLADRIHRLTGDALTLLPTLHETWDMVFLDGNKLEYAAYYRLVIDRVRPGGLILADNVLWSGKVLQPEQDPDAAALHAFNTMVREDSRVEVTLLTLRDGLSILRKK